MPFLDDVFKEIHEVESFTNRRTLAESRAASISAADAERINELAEWYPHLSPDTLMALGRSGFRPDSPQVMQVAGIEARKMQREHPLGRRYGAPSITPGMRRAMYAEQRAGTDPSWSPRTGNPAAIAAWDEARRSGLVQEGVLTAPDGPDAERLGDKYEDILDQLTLAGEEVPVMSFDSASDRWIPRIARRKAEPSAQEQMHAGRPEALRFNDRIDWQNIERAEMTEQGEPEPEGGSPFAGVAGGLAGRLPGASQVQEAGRRYEVEAARGTQSAGITALREAMQQGFAVMDAPVQEFQGQIRNLYGATHGKDVDWWQAQSDFLIAETTSIDDMGEGFFVDQESEVAQERRRREEERGQIGGHNITLGRWVADAAPFATDSKPSLLLSGLVDLGVQIADPTAWALGKVGKAGVARKLFQAADLGAEEGAGVIRGLRNVINGPSAAHWLDSDAGKARLDWISRVTSPTQMYQGFNRKITLDFARQLADEAHTPEEARALLEPQLGTRIREVSTVSMPRNRYFQGFEDPSTGLPAVMPLRGPIDAHNKDIVGHEIEAWLHNAGATTDEIRGHVDAVARADDPISLNAAIRDTLRDADGILAREGVADQGLRDRLTALSQTAHEEASETFKAVQSAQTPTYNDLIAGGVPVHDTGANLYVEHAPKFLTLPDARNVRRAVSKYSRILANPNTAELRLGFAAADWLQNEIWKPVQLVTRIAWPVRVIAEEQIRMAAAGYDSMFRHPIDFIAWGAGRRTRAANDGWLRDPLKNLGDIQRIPGDKLGRAGETGVTGAYIDEMEEFKGSLTTGNGAWVDRAIASPGKTKYNKADRFRREEYTRSVAENIVTLHYDPVAHQVLNTASLDDVKTWFTRGTGNKYRGGLARAHPGKFDSEAQAHAYIEIVAQRAQYMHGGNTEIADVMRTGRWNGRDVFNGESIDPEFISWLDTKVDEFGPDKVVGDLPGVRTGWQGRMKAATDKMFSILMTERTNNLSRSRTFKQAYWNDAARLIPFSTEDTKQAILAAADEANIPNRLKKRMRSAVARGQLELEDVDLIAKGHGLDQTKELLYDLTRRGRRMDALRLVYPFGEAWSEVLTRWFGTQRIGGTTGLIWQNPKTVRRFQQLVQGARGEQFGELMGTPTDGEGNHLGFFWKNSFGEEVFIYPGSGIFTEHTLGVNVPLTGRVQGLSMFGTVMPGLGLVAQVPVGWFMASKPGPEWFKSFLGEMEGMELGPFGTVGEQILPFGSVGAGDQSEIGQAANFLPPWIRNLIQGVSEGDLKPQAYASDLMDTMAYLRTTGKYGDSREELNRLAADAEDKVRGLYFIRALTGMAAPASPDFEFMVENDAGRLLRLAALRDEFFEMMDEDPRTAGQNFLDKYGEDIHAIVATPQTTSARLGTPMTKAGVQWILEHPGIEDDLPYTHGMFAPEGGPDDFSLYNKELKEGRRLRLHPRDWLRLVNHSKGNMIWQQAQNQIDGSPSKGEAAWLRDVADALRDEYPGWADTTNRLEGTDTEELVDELKRAVNHKAIRDTDAAAGLRIYLEAREQALDYAASKDVLHFNDAESMEGTRMWLNDVAEAIMEEHPDFEPLWRWVFSREAEVEPE